MSAQSRNGLCRRPQKHNAERAVARDQLARTALSGHTNTQNTVQMRVLSLLCHISTHEHSKRSPKASSGCSRWPYRPSAQLGQAHQMNGGPGRRCCGVASATPRCRFDFEPQLVPANAWSGDHRQRSLTQAHRRASRCSSSNRARARCSRLQAVGLRATSRKCALLSVLTLPVRAPDGPPLRSTRPLRSTFSSPSIGPAPRIFTVSSVSSEDTTSSLHPFFYHTT